MKKHAAPCILLVCLILFPLVVKDFYYRGLMVLVLMWATIGFGWDILAGHTGQVSFGSAAFFGLGAYASGILWFTAGISAWWGFLVAPLVCAIVAIPFGMIALRLRGAYFALGTLALGEIFHISAKSVDWITRYTNGMEGIQFTQSIISKVPYYYIALALAVGSFILLSVVLRSRLGYYFVSIREDQDAAASMGINTTLYKMISLSFHAVITGLAGALYMNYMGYIDPEVVFSLHDISIMSILVVIVGGVGTRYGPVVGAFVMVAVQEVFRTAGFGGLDALNAQMNGALTGFIKYFKEAHVLAFGVLVVLVILWLPNGIAGDWHRLKRSVVREG